MACQPGLRVGIWNCLSTSWPRPQSELPPWEAAHDLHDENRVFDKEMNGLIQKGKYRIFFNNT